MSFMDLTVCREHIRTEQVDLFDLFVVNSGILKDQLPLVFSSPSLLRRDIIGSVYPECRQLDREELETCLKKMECLTNEYWGHLKCVLKYELLTRNEELLLPFEPDIINFVQKYTVEDFQDLIEQLNDYKDKDIEEFQSFYSALSVRFQYICSMKWFNRFHNEL